MVALVLSLLLSGQVHVDTVVSLPTSLGVAELFYVDSSNQLLVISSCHETLYVLNCVGYAADKALPLHGGGATPAYGVWNWKRSKLYVTLSVPESLFVYDPAIESITSWLPFKHYRSPCYVSTHDWVYAVDDGQLKVIDCASDSVVRTLPPVPYEAWGGVAWDSVGDKVYVAAQGAPQEDVLLAYSCVDDSPVAAVNTGIFYPMVLAQYPLQRKAYLGRDWGAATDSSVAIYDCERDTVTRRLPIRYSHYSHKAVYNPRRGKVYIPGEGNYYDTVFAVDCESDSITGRIVVPPEVGTMILATRTDRLYICCGSPTDRVMVVDCASDSVIASIDVGRGPMYPAYDSTNNRIFVGCQDSTIWVLAEDSSGIAEPNGQSPSAIRYSLGGPTLVRARTQLTLPTDSRLYSTNGRLVGRDTPAPGIYWVTSEHDSPRKVVVVP